MAGAGPAPKLPHERRNTTPPGRGEWVDLAPLECPVLPALEGEHDWDADVLELWSAWRNDPVTSQWSPADVAFARQTIRLCQSSPEKANEIRLRMDSLGVTPKGKRDLRWRITDQSPVEGPSRRPQSEVTTERRARLSVVK